MEIDMETDTETDMETDTEMDTDMDMDMDKQGHGIQRYSRYGTIKITCDTSRASSNSTNNL
jgi:hypothetical protein